MALRLVKGRSRSTLALGATGAAIASIVQYRESVKRNRTEAPAEPVANPHWRPDDRNANLLRLRSTASHPFDVLILGGGSVGSGCALCASRAGFRTALIDAEDFSAGSSSKSTKLFHGGLRYVEQAVKSLDSSKLRFVAEGLRERDADVVSAPHLARQIPTVLPAYSYSALAYSYLGVKVYDLLCGMMRPSLFDGSCLLLGSDAVSRVFPTIQKNGLVGSVLYHDGAFDDSRYNVSVALTAHALGATIANHVRAVRIKKSSDSSSLWIDCQDTTSGKVFTVHTKSVICAAGSQADELKRIVTADNGASKDSSTSSKASSGIAMAPSAGAHIVLPGYYSNSMSGSSLIVPRTKDDRVAFVVPFHDHTIAGTTDDALADDERASVHPHPTTDQIDRIIESIRPWLSLDVTRSDIKSAWSGLRPLSKAVSSGREESSSKASRDHTVEVESSWPALVHVHGGKWTSWRVIAQDAVAAALGKKATSESEAATPLVGSVGHRSDLHAWLARQFSGVLTSDTAKHLACQYGDRSEHVAEIARTDANAHRRLHPNHPHVEAEIRHAARNEMAETASDFLARRTRLAFVDAAAAEQCVARVVSVMASELSWGWFRRRREERETRRFLGTFKVE